ncbi:MAG TPA: hypothetical protein ENI95_03605 [Chloroflexi bacterium]|nr:hypothetical protein [Chloroflexota bacterium]
MFKTPSTPDFHKLDLRIVPLGKLIPHEMYDIHRATPLLDRLCDDGILKNPPVVAPMGPPDDHFVILDGTNRVIALDILSAPHMLVQVVDYESTQVELQTWYHAVSGLSVQEFERRIRSLPGLEIGVTDDIVHARAELARRAILVYYVLPDGEVVTLAGGGLDIKERTRLLNRIVDTYIQECHLNRTNTDEIDELLKRYPRMTATVVFPHYEPVEILDLARSGLRVPAGITRHVIHGRALRLNYPLKKLYSNEPLEQKNRELAEWVQAQFSKKQVRYYAEATYLFDE